MSDNTVIVYSPKGVPEKHTRQNARDLINGAGYTWHKGAKTTPAGFAPFAQVKAPDGPAPSQKVLDSVGGAGSAAAGAAAGAAAAAALQAQQIAAALASQPVIEEPAPEEIADFSAIPVEDTADLDVDLDADPAEAEAGEEPAEATPRRRRGRSAS